MREIPRATARRIALAASGLGVRAAPTRRGVATVAERLGVLQLDSVSAVVRAHYSPVFSRLGKYDPTLLDELVWPRRRRTQRRLVEYWAHEAALIPIDDWPLFRWRMAGYTHGRWGGAGRVLERNPTLPDAVLAAIAAIGPATAGEVEKHLELSPPPRASSWWDLSDTKIICEQLFATGQLSVSHRVAFARHYDLAERVIPSDVFARTIPEADAIQQLVRKSVRALGIATETDIRDYYRLRPAQAAPALAALVAAGEVARVDVAGWGQPGYLDPGARRPRSIDGAALLCPFDPLIFCRPRTERLFDFHYRIEIYTPEHKRVHGYYVFPFLLDGELVGRVDLRAERAARILRVPAAFAEPGVDPVHVADALALELRHFADWLGLDEIVVGDRGDLADLLRVRV